MNSIRNLLCAAAAALAVSPAFAQTIYEPPPGRNFLGVWMIEGDHSTLMTSEGRLPPMNRAARARYDAAVKARKAGKPVGDTVEDCMPHGMPRILFANYPIEVLQEPQQVTFIHEAQHMPRMVYLDTALPPLEALDTLWMGFSAGRWEGDTLVVETAGLYDRTTLDRAGLPHSDQLRITERIRKLDADTLEDVLTIQDPRTYTRPWTARVTYKRKPGYRLQEYVCTDHNPEAAGAD